MSKKKIKTVKLDDPNGTGGEFVGIVEQNQANIFSALSVPKELLNERISWERGKRELAKLIGGDKAMVDRAVLVARQLAVNTGQTHDQCVKMVSDVIAANGFVEFKKFSHRVMSQKGSASSDPWVGENEFLLSDEQLSAVASKWLEQERGRGGIRDLSDGAMIETIAEHPESFNGKGSFNGQVFTVKKKAFQTNIRLIDELGIRLNEIITFDGNEVQNTDLMAEYRHGDPSSLCDAPHTRTIGDDSLHKTKFKPGDKVFVFFPDVSVLVTDGHAFNFSGVMSWVGKTEVKTFFVGTCVPNKVEMSPDGRRVPVYDCIEEGNTSQQFQIKESSMFHTVDEAIQFNAEIVQNIRDTFNSAIENIYSFGNKKAAGDYGD